MISRTTKSFWRLFDALPIDAQRQAVRVGIHWRAMAYREGDTMTWFWIGSHADYDALIGR